MAINSINQVITDDYCNRHVCIIFSLPLNRNIDKAIDVGSFASLWVSSSPLEEVHHVGLLSIDNPATLSAICIPQPYFQQ